MFVRCDEFKNVCELMYDSIRELFLLMISSVDDYKYFFILKMH